MVDEEKLTKMLDMRDAIKASIDIVHTNSIDYKCSYSMTYDEVSVFDINEPIAKAEPISVVKMLSNSRGMHWFGTTCDHEGNWCTCLDLVVDNRFERPMMTRLVYEKKKAWDLAVPLYPVINLGFTVRMLLLPPSMGGKPQWAATVILSRKLDKQSDVNESYELGVVNELTTIEGLRAMFADLIWQIVDTSKVILRNCRLCSAGIADGESDASMWCIAALGKCLDCEITEINKAKVLADLIPDVDPIKVQEEKKRALMKNSKSPVQPTTMNKVDQQVILPSAQRMAFTDVPSSRIVEDPFQ